MKLKNLFIYGLLGSALAACDSIDEKERIIGPIEFESQKNILIEDFTGQNCLNCPNAANAIHTMQEMYGKSHVITVAIHGGAMSIAAPRGLATEDGNAYVSHWDIKGFPSGLIDRSGGVNDNYETWSAAAITRLQLTTPIQLTLNNSYDETSRNLNIRTIIDSEEDLGGKLQLWLVEDSIIGRQTMPNGTMKRDYPHNHVFRSTINGLWGEDIQLTAGDAKETTHAITLDESWEPENVSIVAFVYNDSEVLQTTIGSILPKQ